MLVPILLTNRSATLPSLPEETYNRLRDFWAYAPKGLWYMPQYKQTKILRGQRTATLKQIERLERSPLKPVERIKKLRGMVAESDEKLSQMWDGKIRLLKRNRMSAGLFRATWKEAEEKCEVKFVWNRQRQTVVMRDGLKPAGVQYKHQNACVAAMMQALPRGGGIVLAATASGKTAIAARLFAKVDCDCLFVVDQLDLLYQQQKELASWLGEDVGYVGDSEYKPKRVTVATIQTLNLYRNDPQFTKWYACVEVMVVDELHEQLSKRDFNVLEAIEPVAIFGLTATLQLKHKETRMRAYSFAGPVIFSFPIAEGVKRGVLTKGYALQLLFAPDEALSDDVDYRTELEARVLQNDMKLVTCEELVRLLLLMDRHVVVLTERVAHLKDVSDVLRDIPHGLAYGEVPVEVRSDVKREFEDEEIKVIVTNKVFKKGVNIKRIDAMIDLAEGKSKNDPVQKFGRGLRLHPAKDELIYIDIGTDGKGRFARRAAIRRKALRDAGIDVTVVRNLCDTGQATAALKKFVGRIRNGSGKRTDPHGREADLSFGDIGHSEAGSSEALSG